MDTATIVGLFASSFLVFIAILMGGNPATFFNVPSILIVFGGTLGAALIQFPLGTFLGVVATLKNAFLHRAVPPERTIGKLVEFATIARREGILALESHVEEAGDEFLEKSIQLAIDGTAPELIKDILTTELAFLEDRHALGQSILESMGAMAPAYGMIGTLIGLINMLKTLDDPSTIGGSMAVALITTLYGALAANVVFIPCSGKLKVRTANELLVKEIIIEGILSIQSGDNPRVVEQKLKAFVSPSLREQIGTGS